LDLGRRWLCGFYGFLILLKPLLNFFQWRRNPLLLNILAAIDERSDGFTGISIEGELLLLGKEHL
jgi:hypothetical protein